MPFPAVVALAAYQVRARLRPSILSAMRTGKLCLAGFLPSPLLGYRYRLPMKRKTLSRQFCIRLRVAAVRDNIMAHRLAGFLATWLTGACWLQTELPHFTRPLPVMITFARGLPVGLLPHMGKFMDCRFIDAPVKPFRGKVPAGVCMPLQCHQHLRQTACKKFPIEKVIGS